MVRPAGLEPATCGLGNRTGSSATAVLDATYDERDPVLASCSATLHRGRPDLVSSVQAWSNLPEAMEAGTMAMVKALREPNAQ